MWNPVVIETALYGLDFQLRAFGLLTLIVASSIYPPYIMSMVRGEQTPPRSSWFLFLALDAVAFGSGAASGNFDVMLLTYTIGTFFTALFTIRYGQKGWTGLETASTAITIATIIMWISIGPSVAMICSLLGITIATIPIFDRVVRGEYESLPAWSIALAGSALNLLDGQILVSIWFMIIQMFIISFVIYHYKYLPMKTPGESHEASEPPQRR